MELKVLSQEPNKAQLEIRDADHTFVNSLRRTLIAEVPKMTIDEVDFHLGHLGTEEDPETHKLVDYESLSPLFDEIIAHRLGMLPIPTDLTTYTFSDHCSCGGEGCPSCTMMYSLNKKGPCTVYSGDLEPVMGSEELKVLDPRIPIVTLAPQEGLLLYARAKLGQGRDHAKWQVCSGVGYTYCHTVTIQNHPSVKPLFELFGEENFQKKGKNYVLDDALKVKELLKVLHRFPSNAELRDHLDIKEEADRFLLRFETDGSLTAHEALLYSLRVLSGRFETFQVHLKEMKERTTPDEGPVKADETEETDKAKEDGKKEAKKEAKKDATKATAKPKAKAKPKANKSQ